MMTNDSAPKQTRSPKIDYLVRLCKEMTALGVSEFAFGDFRVVFDPGALREASYQNSIEPPSASSEALEAIRLARLKVEEAMMVDDDLLFHSAP